MSAQDNLDLPYEQRLAIYRENSSAAQTEILRAKLVYEEEKANGASQERLNQISNWANQVRSAAGVNVLDTIYGNNPAISPLVQHALTSNYYNSGGSSTDINPLDVVANPGGAYVPVAGQVTNALGQIGHTSGTDLVSIGLLGMLLLFLLKD